MKHFLLTLILLISHVNYAWADKYYCILFAYDSKPISLPTKCHVWGSYIHTDSDKLVKVVTISWEPCNINYIDRPQVGRNTELKETLDYATKKNRQISMWGPFEIDADFFDKAKTQYNIDGKYKFIDGCSRRSNQNCIHRISDLSGHVKTGIYWGWWAADSVYHHYLRHNVIHETNDKEFIIELLGIKNYSIAIIK